MTQTQYPTGRPVLGECSRCGGRAVQETYWGELICRECGPRLARDFDRAGWWPAPPWEPDHQLSGEPGPIAVIDRAGWHQRDGRCWPFDRLRSAELLGELAAAMRVRQIWMHATVLPRAGWYTFPDPGPGWNRTPEPVDWANYWPDGGGAGFEVCVPSWGDGPFAELDAGELAGELAAYWAATGALWQRSGAITSDRILRAELTGAGRLRVRRTVQPPPALRDERGRPPAGEEPPLRWTRARGIEDPLFQPYLLASERRARWCHAFDLNGAFLAAASSLPLPVGDVDHQDQAPVLFDRRRPGYWLVDLPAWADPCLPAPYGGDRRGGRTWLTTPTVELLADRWSMEPLEAFTWPEAHQYLRRWYERLRDARAALSADPGAALVAVKETYTAGIGRLGSPTRARGIEDPLFQPYWRHAVNAEARARLWARLARTGRRPVAVDVDCVWWLSSHEDPGRLAVELGLKLGAGLGRWKHAGTIAGGAARELLAGPHPLRDLKAAS